MLIRHSFGHSAPPFGQFMYCFKLLFLLPIIDNGMNGADENLDDKNFEPIVKKPKQKRKKRIKGIPGIKEEKGTPSYLKV